MGFDSTSIIRYLEPTTADLFKARHQDCHFYENIFPALAKEEPIQKSDLNWHTQDNINQDPQTKQADEEVRRLLHLNEMIEKIPDAFNDVANMTRSQVAAANAPARVQTSKTTATTLTPRLKRGRPPGTKDAQPRQRKPTATTLNLVTTFNIINPEDTQLSDNEEISIQYRHTGHIYKRKETQLDDQFAYSVIQEITNEIPDPLTIKEAQK